MNKRVHSHHAFTLIEVMIAVMIISLVIAALIQMFANNTHVFLAYKNQIDTNQYTSFLIGNDKYGEEKKSTNMFELVREFDIDDDLRKELKSMKVDVDYVELKRINLSESESESGIEISSDMALEIGKSNLQKQDGSALLYRFKLQ